MAARANRQQAGMKNLLVKIESCMETENYYEAQQLYETVARRMMMGKTHEVGADVLDKGAKRLFEAGQANMAARLCHLICEMLTEGSVQLNDARESILLELHDRFPQEQAVFQLHLQFLKNAVQWSVKCGPSERGSGKLNLALGRLLWKHGDYSGANPHMLRSDAYLEHAAMVIEWSNQGYPSERDLFVCRTVLQYLCLQNMEGANAVFSSITDAFEALDSPLIHFTEFLLKTLERDAEPLFRMLRTKYAPSIKRDPSFSKHLDLIGKEFYGIEPQAGGIAGLLGSLLSGS